jgi:ParB family transcriptional regulator, chromosome partitioning protein
MAKQAGDTPKPGNSRLGRGLGALIPVPVQPTAVRPAAGTPPTQVPVVAPASTTMTPAPAVVEIKSGPAATRSTHDVVMLPMRSIQPGKYQPRGGFDPAALEALAASIEQSGLMQPIVVRPLAGRPGAYELIAGERRWRAMDRLGRGEVPAIIQEVDDARAAELALVENLQREDLNPMDRATALRRLGDEFGWTHQELASRIGLDRATVTNLLRLNELDPGSASHVRAGHLTLGHAKVLLGVADVVARRTLADRSVAEGWSVRQLEAATREVRVPRGTKGTRAKGGGTAHLADLRRRLEEHLGTRVDLRLGRKKGAGELRILFFSLDEFDGVMQRIGFKTDRTSS